jgi:hypothetical protein
MLKECTMMKNYMTTRTFAKGKTSEGDLAGKADAPFPEEKAVMSIYGGPAPHESRCMLKLVDRAINVVSIVVLEYLRWSESPSRGCRGLVPCLLESVERDKGPTMHWPTRAKGTGQDAHNRGGLEDNYRIKSCK